MISVNFFDKIGELKEKFKRFFYHKKKLQALENISSVIPFQHKDYLILIKRCMDGGFLGEHEADFLSYMIDKYFSEQNFLDWTHKTRWLKGEILRLSGQFDEKQFKQMTMFDFDKAALPTPHIPVELLGSAQKRPYRRIAG
jgi:hypothetical protein